MLTLAGSCTLFGIELGPILAESWGLFWRRVGPILAERCLIWLGVVPYLDGSCA